MVPEAPITRTEHGLAPNGEGWFVLNAQEAKWVDGHFGAYTRFEGEPRFPQLGFNIAEHVFVGAGEGPCAILAVGTRLTNEVVYPRSEVALRHKAGVEKETREPREAYAEIPADDEVPYRPGWLPGA